jgi:hypothetical protein
MSTASIIASTGTADRLNRRTNHPTNRGPLTTLSVAGPFGERTTKAFVAPEISARAQLAAAPPPELPPIRTSQIMREILTRNPNQRTFTVKQIVDSIGEERHAASLMFFSIPAMLPVPGTSDLTGIPSSLLAGQMIAGKRTIRLPEVVLRRSVSRRSLTVAIHAILPILETAQAATAPAQRSDGAADPRSIYFSDGAGGCAADRGIQFAARALDLRHLARIDGARRPRDPARSGCGTGRGLGNRNRRHSINGRWLDEKPFA